MPDDSKKENKSIDAHADVFSASMKKRIERAKGKSVDQMLQSMKPVEKKKRKKPYILIIITVFVTLFTSGIAVFAFWYQNPGNVVTDAIARGLTSESISAKGDLIYNNAVGANFDTQFSYDKGSNTNIELSVGNDAQSAIKLSAEAVSNTEGDIYFRTENLTNLVSTFLDQAAVALRLFGVPDSKIIQQQQSLRNVYEPAAKNVDNQWIKYGASEIQKSSEKDAREYECVFEMVEEIGENPGKLADIGSAYYSNRVVIVKESLGMKNGNSGFVVDVDYAAAARFADEAAESQIFKELTNCSGGTITADDLKSLFVSDTKGRASELRIEVWVDYWTHQLKQIIVTDEDGLLEMEANFTFNEPVKATLPTDFVPYTKVQSDITDLLGFTANNPFAQR